MHMGKFLFPLFKWSKALSSKLPVSLPAYALGLFQYFFQVTDDWKFDVLHSKASSRFLAEVSPVKLCRSFNFPDPWQLKLIEKKSKQKQKQKQNSWYKLWTDLLCHCPCSSTQGTFYLEGGRGQDCTFQDATHTSTISFNFLICCLFVVAFSE